MKEDQKIVIYQTPDGKTQIDVMYTRCQERCVRHLSPSTLSVLD